MSNEKKILGTSVTTFVKEGVAAALGLIIVLGTLLLLWPSLTSSPVDIDSAQGIFSILGGWGGVVIGYYFGRLPAEKAASKAEEVADAARREKDTAEKVTANTLADSSKTLSESAEELDKLQKKLEKYKELIDELTK